MRKTSTPFTLAVRIAICFLFWLSACLQVLSQQNKVSNERLKVWQNMIHRNSVYISAYMGYGSYSMYSIRNLQKEIITKSGMNATPNSNFPAYWLYGLSVSRKYDSSRFGFDLEFMSTGARSSVADYSGQYFSDIKCSGLKLGVFYEKDFSYKVSNIKNLSFGYRLEAGGLSSNVYQQSQITLTDTDQGNIIRKIHLISIATFIEPALVAKWQIEKKTFVQLSTGFLLDIPLGFTNNYSLPEYQIGWAGYRIKLGLVQQL